MHQLAKLVLLPPRLAAHPLLKFWCALLKFRKGGESDENEGGERVLDERVELRPRSEEDAEGRRKDGGVNALARSREEDDSAEKAVLRLRGQGSLAKKLGAKNEKHTFARANTTSSRRPMPRRNEDPAIAGTASIRTSFAQFLRLSSMYPARTSA